MIIETRTNLDISEFVLIVDNIVSGFFDEDGKYTPHIGTLNSMCLFWNYYVTSSDCELGHNIEDASEMELLVSDNDFIKAYNDAVLYKGEQKLDFANAYYNAQLIVENKKNSFERVIENAEKMIFDLLEKIAPMFSEDNLAKIEKIGKDIAKGKISNETIAQAAINSGLIKNIGK